MHTTPATHDVRIAYFYFDFNDPEKQTVEMMLRSLVFQLAVSAETIPQALRDLYSRHQAGRGIVTQPEMQEWTSVLRELLSMRGEFYVVIDALDECREEDFLIDSIKALVQQSVKSTRWLFTRQISEDVASSLRAADVLDIDIESVAVNRDIATYLQATLENDNKLQTFGAKAKNLIRSEIHGKAGGMLVLTICGPLKCFTDFS